MGHLIIPMLKRPCPIISGEEIINAPDPIFKVDYEKTEEIMHDMPHWTDDYIEMNSDGKYECFDEYDHLIGTVYTKEDAKRLIEKYFE